MATLGNTLKRAGGLPQTGKAVEFWLIAKDESARLQRHKCAAQFVPVDPVDRRRAYDEADRSIESDRENTTGDVDHERSLQFLARALRDPEDLRKRYVEPDVFHRFRIGLMPQQIRELLHHYNAFMLDEYPTSFTADERKAIEKEAESFFGDTPASSTGSSPPGGGPSAGFGED